jgi:hypothetical protein
MHGSVCYGCNGAGQVVANHARKAWGAYNEAVKEASSRPVEEIKVGDAIMIQDRGNKFVRYVVLGMSVNTTGYVSNGVEIPTTTFHLENLNYTIASNSVIRVPLAEQVDPAAFLATIKEPK